MTDAGFLVSSYDPWGVTTSVLIATLAAYVALDLAKRVRTADLGFAWSWWAGGALALGTGIWAMHFIGMLAFSLPIALGHTKLLTALSWLAAVGVAAVALAIASRDSLRPGHLLAGALAMGAGICAMHYIGMAALDIVPGVVWNRWLVAASALIAVGASGAALTIFFRLRQVRAQRGPVYQVVAALLMGLAISGMHYTGMAAAAFPEGSVCLGASSLAGPELSLWIVLASGLLLALTLATSIADARLRTADLTTSLSLANQQLLAANAELQQRAFIDPLTELPNRLLFEDRLAQALARHARVDDRSQQHKLAVLFIDLDAFKPVNDSLGHAAGDQVLKEAAKRLRRTARDSDTLARVGGDEFLLLMEEVGSAVDCVDVARRLMRELARPFDVAGQMVEVSGSVGIVLYPDQGHPDKLIAHADAAMYAAKRAGGNSYAVFESHMEAGALAQLNLQTDLRHAVELGQMQLHYQPKVDARRGQISGVEALLRWNHPQRGVVSPLEFIPLAERFGLINALGSWVIDEACRQMQQWADDGLRMRVAINLSVYQLREGDLAERIGAALRRHQVEPSQLLCEITESVAMEDIAATQRTFEELAGIGVFLSIDDFGTGYSSLSYLRQLPARQLKIDRSFINDMEGSSDARAIVDAVVRLAHALGLVVVAEGVETEAQQALLTGLGCDELQGYFFARPMPADTLLAWTQGRKPAGSVDFTPSVLHETA